MSLLREIVNVHQRPGEPFRRWFHTTDQDLYVWTGENGAIVAFEYCYVLGRKEQAVVWKADGGLSHYLVDQGESSVLANRTPLLRRAGAGDMETVLGHFAAAAERLPADIADFVRARLG